MIKSDDSLIKRAFHHSQELAAIQEQAVQDHDQIKALVLSLHNLEEIDRCAKAGRFQDSNERQLLEFLHKIGYNLPREAPEEVLSVRRI